MGNQKNDRLTRRLALTAVRKAVPDQVELFDVLSEVYRGEVSRNGRGGPGEPGGLSAADPFSGELSLGREVRIVGAAIEVAGAVVRELQLPPRWWRRNRLAALPLEPRLAERARATALRHGLRSGLSEKDAELMAVAIAEELMTPPPPSFHDRANGNGLGGFSADAG